MVLLLLSSYYSSVLFMYSLKRLLITTFNTQKVLAFSNALHPFYNFCKKSASWNVENTVTKKLPDKYAGEIRELR